MGNLGDFVEFLDERHAVLDEAENGLLVLQARFEEFLAELGRVREAELAQLRAHLLAGDGVPAELTAQLEQAAGAARVKLDAEVARLEGERDGLLAEAEGLRTESADATDALREHNVELDDEEEKLKARSAELLASIAEHNRRILGMGRGFGFFLEFFAMRRLQAQRAELQEAQDDLAARIDVLRGQWASVDQEHAIAEEVRQARWVAARTEAAALQTKIDYLRSAGDRIVERSALEEVLFARRPPEREPGEGDPACPRCERPNPTDNHFCHICGQRLVEDRPDLEGSLAEVAEVNLHHHRFSEGVKSCQEIIALVRGLCSGLDAFKESVTDMQSTQWKHDLATLDLDVPRGSRRYAEHFARLRERVTGAERSLHPSAFASHVTQLTGEVFTEDKIQQFFELMGEELSRQADSQW